MTTDTIPESIAARIERAVAELRQRAEQEERERAEAESREQAEIAEAWEVFDNTVAAVQIEPPMLAYLVPENRDRQRRPGSSVYLTLQVPGLAPIKAVFEKRTDGYKIDRYLVAGVDIGRDYDDGQICQIGWDWRYATECRNPDRALIEAKERSAAYAESLSGLEHVNQARAELAQERERNQAEREQRQAEAESRAERERETEAVRQLREEQLLLDVLKDNPIAVALLKLFVTVQAEREHWQARIDRMEEAAAWSQEHLPAHLARVREEARSYERLAREADDRARNLDIELDETKRKAKKAGVKV